MSGNNKTRKIRFRENKPEDTMYLNTQLSLRLKLARGKARVTIEGMSLTLPYLIDDLVPDNTVVVASGLKNTIALGKPYGVVEVEEV